VLAAGKGARPALSKLCELYWDPLYAFVRRQGLSADDAKDLTQGFFTRLLEKNDLAVADPSRGRFRAWLLTAARHYLANEWDRERAKKRGGAQLRLPLEDAEAFFSRKHCHGLTPERAYDRRWAEMLLQRVLETLGEEYRLADKESRFDKLKGTLTRDEGDSYASIAAELGMEVGAVRIAAFRLRERFKELLHEEILHTVEKPEDVDDELRFLLSTFEDEDE